MCAKVLFVLMPEQFQDHEFNVPHTMLVEHKNIVDVAGFKQGIAIGSFGLKVTPNLQLSNLSMDDYLSYDALIIPGGAASTKYLWFNKELQKVVQFFHMNKKLVATICYACIVPVQAGILTHKKATVYPTDEAKAVFKQHHVEFVNQGTVVLTEDKIITAQGPTFAKEFGKVIITSLTSQPRSEAKTSTALNP
jgi:putative intracellular protease/amidase